MQTNSTLSTLSLNIMTTTVLLGLVLLLCIPAHAQEFNRKYLSAAGQDLGFDYASTRPAFGKRMDFNGDGKPELIVHQEDDDGNVTGISIYDPRTGTAL